jgi:hypothetical protein
MTASKAPTLYLVITLSLLGLAGVNADPIPADVPHATIERAAGPITIDGRLDEPSWAATTHIDSFSFPWWTEGERERTEARMLWDDKALYVGFRAIDSHVSATLTERDDPVSRDDCVEVFIAPDTSDVSIYYNFEFNALGTTLDRSPHQERSSKWNADSLRVAVTIDGTINKQDDIDSLWTTEIAIPFDVFAGFAPHLPPMDGDVWRLNLYRTGGAINLQYITWSPTQAEKPSFHVPKRFGVVHFSRNTVTLDGTD